MFRSLLLFVLLTTAFFRAELGADELKEVDLEVRGMT
jgi:hypothetical protein